MASAGVAVLAVALTVWPGHAVTVAPHALFMGDEARIGQVELLNGGDGAEEVTIELVYGYPVSTENGAMRVALMPDHGPEARSAAEWLRPFPRRVRLDPGQSQIVRIQATPPDDLPDGEYWSRLIVTSSRAAPTPSVDTEQISIGVGVRVRTITSVTYRVGEAETGVTIDSLSAAVSDGSLGAWIGLDRSGNAAYLGSIGFELLDDAGRVVTAWDRRPVAVYEALYRRYVLPLDTVPSGSYTLRASLTVDREDIPADRVLPAEPAERTTQVIVP